MSLHARLSPSDKSWPHCPGSPREQAKYSDESGDAAIDGTGSHCLLEMIVLETDGLSKPVSEWLDQTICEGHEDKPGGWFIEKDRCERVQMGINYINRRVDELRKEHPRAMINVYSESKSNPGGLCGRSDWWGTCDIVIEVMYAKRCAFIETIDYKDGRGWVAEKDNSQLISYMMGKLRPHIATGPSLVRPFHPLQVEKCRMTIVQPRVSKPIRYVSTTPSVLLDAYYDLENAAFATDKPDAPLIADGKGGKGYCTWCKHKDNCEALANQGFEGVDKMVDTMKSVTAGDSGFLSLVGKVSLEDIKSEQLSDILDSLPAIEDITKKIKAEAFKRALADPNALNGWTTGPGNNKNVWADDPETVEKKLKGMRVKKDLIYPSKLISPAQAQKLPGLTERQKTKLTEEMITTIAGDIKLVKVNKKAKPSAETMFIDPAVNFVEKTEKAVVPTFV